MRNGRKAKGQSTAEYAVVIAIVLGAVIGMQTFVKRGLQGRYKLATDTLTKVPGAANIPGFESNLSQYEPYYAQQSITTTRRDAYNEFYNVGKFSKTGALTNILRNGFQNEGVDQALANAWK